MKKILSMLCMLLSALSVSATHMAGGEIRYEFNGVNYTIDLSVYQLCDPGTLSLEFSNRINISSAQAGINFKRDLPRVSLDTVSVYCSGGVNSCNSTGSTLTGSVVAHYRDTVTIPVQATDWVISFYYGGRSSLSNLQSYGHDFYVEAKLNNTVGVNSNAFIPNPPSYFTPDNYASAIPLSTLDADGDSIAYEWITPLEGAASPMSYYPSYSLSVPLGVNGSVSIDAVKQVLNIQAHSVGRYGLAFRVKEYRNQVLVGSYIRDFAVYSNYVNTGSQMKYPMPVFPQSLTVNTCPGQHNAINVLFYDSSGFYDSVYTSIEAPNMPGWNFSTGSQSNKATGSVQASWVTPASMNPATTRPFFFKVKVHDNACPTAYADYAIMVRPVPCDADSVWPGDADNNGIVDLYDPLALAVAMGHSGSARVNPLTSWIPQSCYSWNNNFATTNVNMKHADCDGDGAVTTADLPVIAANYSLTHPKEGGEEKQTAGPSLYFDVTGIKAYPGTTIHIPVKLGDANMMMTGFYGIAARITFNPTVPASTPTSPASISGAAGSWLGTGNNTIVFNKSTSPQVLDWAYARTDQQNQSGQGAICILNVDIPASAVPGSFINILLSKVKLIDKDGFEITEYSPVNTIIEIPYPEGVTDLPEGFHSCGVVPNPSHSTASLQLSLDRATSVQVRVTNILGQTVWQQTANLQAGHQSITLPAAQLPGGMYTIHVQAGDHGNTAVVKWVKQ